MPTLKVTSLGRKNTISLEKSSEDDVFQNKISLHWKKHVFFLKIILLPETLPPFKIEYKNHSIKTLLVAYKLIA